MKAASRGSLPSGSTGDASGPRFPAAIALLMGLDRLSKRPIRAILADMTGLKISMSIVSKAEGRAEAATAPPPVD